jgi:hypothetical protein
MIGVLDGDILCYRVAAASNDVSLAIARSRLDTVIEDLIVYALVDCTDFEAFLTGEGNFRNEVAKTQPYKGNRKTLKRPDHLEGLKNHAISSWGFTVVDGIEADDAIGKLATKEESIIVSIDKDLDMIPGNHYNFVKKIFYYVCHADAIKNFYRQLLTGDRTDNIPGLVGIGPKKAEKILGDSETELEMYQSCLKAYDGNLEYLKEQAALLWIQQTGREQWKPPVV